MALTGVQMTREDFLAAGGAVYDEAAQAGADRDAARVALSDMQVLLTATTTERDTARAALAEAQLTISVLKVDRDDLATRLAEALKPAQAPVVAPPPVAAPAYTKGLLGTTSTKPITIPVDGQSAQTHCAGRPYGLNLLDGGVRRYEARKGDYAYFDPPTGKSRCEIWLPKLIKANTLTAFTADSFLVEAGGSPLRKWDGGGLWDFVSQVHVPDWPDPGMKDGAGKSVGGDPLALTVILDDKGSPALAAVGSSSTAVPNLDWAKAPYRIFGSVPLTLGQELRNLRLEFVNSQSKPGGLVRLTVDGKVGIEFKGPTGHAWEAVRGSGYWKEGVYGDGAVERAIQVRNGRYAY